jgi:predicted SnoaL-like aldol condensation-catalyzing enzyme
MIKNMLPNSAEYRQAVEDAKDRIVSYFLAMRKEYPNLSTTGRGLIHIEVEVEHGRI